MLKTYNLDSAGSPAFPAQFRVLKAAVLNRTDLQANNNKFYVLEIHEAQHTYRLFTNYGRVGTTGTREGRYADNLPDVLTEFERLYREKTSKSKGYVPVDIKQATVGSTPSRSSASRSVPSQSGGSTGSDCFPSSPSALNPFPNAPAFDAPGSFATPAAAPAWANLPGLMPAPLASTLHPELARFVSRIYDATKAELVRRIETPLGSLTNAQIERGQDKLREIRFAIARRRQERLVALTSEYFSLVPHRLGMRITPADIVIDTIQRADEEEDVLQLMRDVFGVQDSLEADVDRQFRALHARLDVLDKTSAEYARVERRVTASKSVWHNSGLRVRRIFAARLPDERARFHAQGEPLDNVQELFHGTPTPNLVGILSRGLLIAPRNAPCTGAMFGKGIYFADQSSKSAGYCRLSNNARGCPESGYMFLADVALGRVKRERLACYREHAPIGYDSVQGCKGMYLAHNEFIVYEPSQCTLRYIVEIENC